MRKLLGEVRQLNGESEGAFKARMWRTMMELKAGTLEVEDDMAVRYYDHINSWLPNEEDDL